MGKDVLLGIDLDTTVLKAGMAVEFHRMLEAVKARGASDALVVSGASEGPSCRRMPAVLLVPLPVRWQVCHDLAAALAKARAVPPLGESALSRVHEVHRTCKEASKRMYDDRSVRQLTPGHRSTKEVQRP